MSFISTNIHDVKDLIIGQPKRLVRADGTPFWSREITFRTEHGASFVVCAYSDSEAGIGLQEELA